MHESHTAHHIRMNINSLWKAPKRCLPVVPWGLGDQPAKPAIVSIPTPRESKRAAAATKTETMIENMADGEGKIAAQKEIAAAQDAMLSGKMGACAAHLSKAMHVGTAK
jgi:hypothetical protein